MLGHLSWSDLLRRWSGEAIAHAEPLDLAVTPQMGASGWIGAPPALATEIAATQERLGRALPKSYLDFLEVSDGWPALGVDFEQLRPVNAVDWVVRADPTLYAAVSADHGYEWPLDGDDGPPLMNRALTLSTGLANFLFDTGRTGSTGEWSTTCWTSWHPGAGDRQPSFRAGMESHYARFVASHVPDSVTHSEVAERVEDAYCRSLCGERSAEATISGARRYGNLRAEVLDMQAAVFTTQHLAVNGVVALAKSEHAADPALIADLWPMLVVAAFSLHQPQPWCLDQAIAAAPQPVAVLLRAMADRCHRESGLTADFGYAPGFDRAARQARELAKAGRDAEAFEVISDALPLWRPLSPLHLVPVALIWDHELGRIMTRERRERLLATPRAGRSPRGTG